MDLTNSPGGAGNSAPASTPGGDTALGASDMMSALGDMDLGGGDTAPVGDAGPAEVEGVEGDEFSFDGDEGAGEGSEVEGDGLDEAGEPIEETAAAPEEPAEPAAKPAEELPEGVRSGKDRNGKDGYWIRPERFKDVYEPARLLVREASELIGEPLTKDAIELRDRAYTAQEKLYGDMLSGEPEAQGRVIDHIIAEAKRAVEDGEVGTDPMTTFAGEMYSQLQAKNPDAWAALRHRAAVDLIEEMYQEAAQGGSQTLWRSIQHVDKAIRGQYRPEAEMPNLAKPADPAADLRAENERLRAQLTSKTAGDQAAQRESYRSEVNQAISKAVTDEAVMPALASAAEAYKQFPEKWKQITEQVNAKVRESFRSDGRLKDRANALMQAAARATSAQRRQEIAGQIVTLYRNHAKLTADTVKVQILKEAALGLKAQSDATHQRREAAQTQKSAGPGRTVTRPLVDVKKVASMGTVRDAHDMLRLLTG